jgi:hypothetical protein
MTDNRLPDGVEALGPIESRFDEALTFGALDFLAALHPKHNPVRLAPPAPGLEDRRVEVTGPPEAKMAINALNSGGRVWLADSEDANTQVRLSEGQVVSRELVEPIVAEELAALGGPDSHADGRQLFEAVVLSDDFEDFLTLPAHAEMP